MSAQPALAQAPDTLSLEEVYTKYYRRVFSICMRILKNYEEAEDLTQNTFIQVGRKLHTFQNKAAFTTWLHRVTINTVLMYLRLNKRKRQVEIVVDTEEGEEERDYDATFVESHHNYTQDPSLKLDLERAITQLPKGYRTVLVLKDYYGFEHLEIAKIMGLTEGTVKSQLFKARAKMRRLFGTISNPKVNPYDALSRTERDNFLSTV